MSKLDLAVVFELIDKISAPAKKVRGVTWHLNQSLDKTLNSIKNLSRQQKEIKDFSKLSNKLSDQNRKLTDAQRNYKQLQQQLKATESPTQSLRNKVSRAAKQVNVLSIQQKELRIQLNKGRKSLHAQMIDTKNLTAAQKKLETQLGQTGRRYKLYQKTLRAVNAGKQFLGKAAGAGKFALGAAGAGFSAVLFQLKSAADQADEVATIAANLKIDSFNLQALRFQGELNGVSGENIDQALTRFSKRMGRLKGDFGAIFGLLNKTDKAFCCGNGSTDQFVNDTRYKAKNNNRSAMAMECCNDG